MKYILLGLVALLFVLLGTVFLASDRSSTTSCTTQRISSVHDLTTLCHTVTK